MKQVPDRNVILNDMLRAQGFLVLVVAALAGAASAQSQFLVENSINWRTLRSGTDSRITGQQMIVIPSENQFLDYWQRSTGNPAGTAPTQNIDWNRQELVAIHLGTRPSSGFDVRVTSVKRENNLAIISAVEETPLRGQAVSKSVTNPWTIIQVDRTAADFRISWSARESHPQIILGPGSAYIGPGNRDGAGWVPLQNQCDWGLFRQGTDSNVTSPSMQILNSEFDFQAYYRRAFDGPVPSSGNDWLRYRLVAIHLGSRDTTGYQITVKNVIRTGASAVIRAFEQQPIPGSAIRRRQTEPWVLIRVERSIIDFSLDMQREPINDKIVVVDGHGNR